MPTPNTDAALDKLIKAAQEKPVTEEDVAAFAARLEATQEEFAEEMSAYSVDNAWLNRRYTI